MNPGMTLAFDPLLSWPFLWALAGALAAVLAVALWRGLSGWFLRGLAGAAILFALSGPSLQQEERQSLSDIVILLVDDSASQGLGTRRAQTESAVRQIQSRIGAMANTELRVKHIPDGEDDRGTLAMTAMAEALADEPLARVAGIILISDGRVHDLPMAPESPAPFHLLLTGEKADWDRRLVVRNAPAFAIVGEEVSLKLMIEDLGAVPGQIDQDADLSIAIDEEPPQHFQVPVGQELELPITLQHGGLNALQFEIASADGELTRRNNSATIQINGIRDRLRVLLISGEPHAGERVWRNLLKSDASVDLVHFTILRPPEKQDYIPVEEMSLIAFPTRELFVEKIDDFDLIIFDRYRMRGILPMSYIDNIVDYVRKGGTLLVSAGPEFGMVDSLYRTPLAAILPVSPTAQVVEKIFRPRLTDLGRRHPVTEGLEAYAPAPPSADGEPGWGPWVRAIEVEQHSGQVVMEGPDNLPLLVLDRVDDGRVAVLASDQAWLWARGYQGGGPQLELLRRLAHWMLKEPELEEEALSASVAGDRLTITRHTIREEKPGPLRITPPDGESLALEMQQISAGKYSIDWEAPEQGLYRLNQDDLTRVIGVGPAQPREYEQPIAHGADVIAAMRAPGVSLNRIEDGFPDIRPVAAGRVTSGRGWIGITPREAHVTTEITRRPLLPGWAWLVIAALFAVSAWLHEGRWGQGD